MKITLNQDIRNFYQRCLDNITKPSCNEFLGEKITKNTEKQVLKKLKKYGVYQDSLYLSTQDFLNTPYYQKIHLDQINNSAFQYSKDLVEKDYLFNFDSIQFDKNKELRDFMILKALDRDCEVTVLRQNNEVWMMDVPSETNTIDPHCAKAHGNTLTFGLGIGYFIFTALMNPKVKSVTVVERSKEVIELFKETILPQFDHPEKVHIIEGDAFDYFNEPFISKYDYVLIDIHKSNDDGFEIFHKMLEQYLPPFDKVDFWIEHSCFEFMPTLILLYFVNSSKYKKIDIHSHYKKVYQKIQKYFSSINCNIDDVDTLKNWMYDVELMRKILHIHL